MNGCCNSLAELLSDLKSWPITYPAHPVVSIFYSRRTYAEKELNKKIVFSLLALCEELVFHLPAFTSGSAKRASCVKLVSVSVPRKAVR
jgi:hypothetical protein